LYLLICLFCGAFLKAQNGIPGSQLRYFAQGTGRTTGEVVKLTIYNPTPGALQTTVGDCFVPSDKDYQGYVILQTYPVTVAPFGSVSISMTGYCTNAQHPPVPAGETMSDVSQWVSWADGDPLPAPDLAPGLHFVRMPGAPVGDPLALTYPGSLDPFLYTIHFNRYPRQAARILLYAAYAAEQAYDALAGEGKIQGRASERRQEMVQQALWSYTARLEGRSYNKSVFTAQFKEEAEQILNEEQTSFPPETKKQIEQSSEDMWSGIQLVGVSAKLIPPQQDHPAEPFKESPAGPTLSPAEILPVLIGQIDPTQPGAMHSLLPIQLYVQNNPSTHQAAATDKWEKYLDHAISTAAPESPAALPHLLELAGLLQSAAGSTLQPGVRQSLINRVVVKLNSHVQYSVESLQIADPAYIEKWRKLKSWQTTHWYRTYCAASNPLQKLPVSIPIKKLAAGLAGQLNLSGISMANPQWKHSFPIPVAAVPRKFPWWIPGLGVPIVGGGLYLILRDKGDDPLPAPPLATPDAISLSCGSQGTLNVLNNDTGEGIRVTSVNGANGILISVTGTTSVLIATNVPGVYTATYTITDRIGQTAVGNISVTVGDLSMPLITCPPPVSLEGCSEAPAPSVSGHATSIDDCDPVPEVLYVDQMGGNVCTRLFFRTWTVRDNTGKMATCTQTITVTDLTPPVITACPEAVTVPFGQHTNLGLTGQALAVDACAGQVTPVFTDDFSGLTGCNGIILREWTASDNCINTATCVQAISVTDNNAPLMSCPTNTVTVDCGQQHNLAVTGQATATDECNGSLVPVYTDNPPTLNDCFGVITRTWTATDPGGNVATCIQSINVQDQSAPVFTVCPPNITVLTGQQNDLGITGQAAATDACTPSTVTPIYTDDVSGLGLCGGIVLRNWSATDNCGNMADCVQTIQVADLTPPAITCPGPASVDCGQQNNLGLTGQATATDNCSGPVTPTYTDNPPTFSACSGTIQRTWTGADPGGNTATCVQQITVTDQSNPVFTLCPTAITVSLGQQNDLNITGQATATDACMPSGVTPVFTDNLSGMGVCGGTILRNWTATDNCDNSVTCAQTITVVDSTPPIVTCPGAVSVNCGQQNNLGLTGQATATDNCPGPMIPTYTDNPPTFSGCSGVIQRSWTATDPGGNTATCVQQVTVTDQTAPVFTFCPNAISVSFGQQNNLNITGQATATDACTPSGVTPVFTDNLSGMGVCSGTIVRNWTASDNCENSVSCAQTITVVEAPPVITCPGAVSVNCGQQNNLNVTGQATATDNCTGNITPTYTDTPPTFSGCSGVLQRRWSAADAGGNTVTCMQQITVTDQSAPVFTLCPIAITVSLGQQNNLNLTGQATATDACTSSGVTPVFTDNLSGMGVCGGTILRNWTATDNCDNSTSCVQTITVVDASAPDISCPGAVSVDCGQQNNLGITGQATATDNCAGALIPTYSDNPPTFNGCSGVIQRSWTAADPGGNTATCVQQITVTDQTAPVFTLCPATITVSPGQQNNLSITGQATATDACVSSGVTPVFTDNLSGMGVCSGSIIRNWSATDNCDNSATCAQTINVVDATPPVITCPANILVNCGQQSNLNVTGQATATDNCAGAVSLTSTDTPPTFNACSGSIQRRWTATDAAGNTASCIQQINVTDQTAPVFTFCPPSVTVSCGQQNNLNITGMATATDACNSASAPTFTNNTSGFNNCQGVIVRTFTSTDACNNTATCQQNITVINTPCTFSPFFAIGNAFCGACNGSVSTTVSPGGSYTYQWSNGATGPNLTGLCAGQMTVTITNQTSQCSDIYNVTIQNVQIPVVLSIVSIQPPTSPSASNGRVTLQVSAPGFIPPLLVFVNGNPVGSANTATFLVTNMPVGIFQIRVVNNGGEGCTSNTVVVEMFPPETPPPVVPEFSFESVPLNLPVLDLGAEQPIGIPAVSQYFWNQTVGMAAGLPLGKSWQLRLGLVRQSGWQQTASGAGASVPAWNIPAPVTAERQSLSLRRYFPFRSGLLVFQENTVARAVFRTTSPWLQPTQNPVPVSLLSEQWQVGIGGGLRFSPVKNIDLEVSGQLLFPFKTGTLSSVLQMRLHVPFLFQSARNAPLVNFDCLTFK